MLTAHKRYIAEVFLKRRISLLLGFLAHEHNKSILQVLSFDIFKIIIQHCGVPNNNNLVLIKSNGWSSIVTKYNGRYAFHNQKIPCLYWLKSFMQADKIMQPDAKMRVFPEWFNEGRNILTHKTQKEALEQCGFWTNCSRWYLKGWARNPYTQLLVYECDMLLDNVVKELNLIFGECNVTKFCLLRALPNDCTQIFLSAATYLLNALKDDVIFEAYNAVSHDDRIMALKAHKAGFVVNV